MESSLGPILNCPRGSSEFLGACSEVLITTGFRSQDGPLLWALRITLQGSSVFQGNVSLSENCTCSPCTHLLCQQLFLLLSLPAGRLGLLRCHSLQGERQRERQTPLNLNPSLLILPYRTFAVTCHALGINYLADCLLVAA